MNLERLHETGEDPRHSSAWRYDIRLALALISKYRSGVQPLKTSALLQELPAIVDLVAWLPLTARCIALLGGDAHKPAQQEGEPRQVPLKETKPVRGCFHWHDEQMYKSCGLEPLKVLEDYHELFSYATMTLKGRLLTVKLLLSLQGKRLTVEHTTDCIAAIDRSYLEYTHETLKLQVLICLHGWSTPEAYDEPSHFRPRLYYNHHFFQRLLSSTANIPAFSRTYNLQLRHRRGFEISLGQQKGPTRASKFLSRAIVRGRLSAKTENIVLQTWQLQALLSPKLVELKHDDCILLWLDWWGCDPHAATSVLRDTLCRLLLPRLAERGVAEVVLDYALDENHLLSFNALYLSRGLQWLYRACARNLVMDFTIEMPNFPLSVVFQRLVALTHNKYITNAPWGGHFEIHPDWLQSLQSCQNAGLIRRSFQDGKQYAWERSWSLNQLRTQQKKLSLLQQHHQPQHQQDFGMAIKEFAESAVAVAISQVRNETPNRIGVLPYLLFVLYTAEVALFYLSWLELWVPPWLARIIIIGHWWLGLQGERGNHVCRARLFAMLWITGGRKGGREGKEEKQDLSSRRENLESLAQRTMPSLHAPC